MLTTVKHRARSELARTVARASVYGEPVPRLVAMAQADPAVLELALGYCRADEGADDGATTKLLHALLSCLDDEHSSVPF